MFGRKQSSWPVLAAACLGLVLFLGVREAVPFALVSDQAFFLPASWWFAQTGHLSNPWMQPGFNESLNWHGFLQPLIVGLIARATVGGWAGSYLGMNVLALLTVLLVATCAVRFRVSAVAAVGLVVVAAALMLDARARPEVLATAETVGIAALAAVVLRGERASGAWSFALGVVVALLAMTHPVDVLLSGAALGTAFLVALVSGRVEPRRLAVSAAGVAVGGLVTLAGFVLMLGPAFFGQWLSGIAAAGKLTMLRGDVSGFVRYDLENRFIPGFVVLLAVGGVVLVPYLNSVMRQVRPAKRIVLIGSVSAVFAVLVYRFVLRIPATYYNFTGVMVALLFVLVLVATRPLERRIVGGTLALLAVGATVGIATWVAQSVSDIPNMDASRAALRSAVLSDTAANRKICADTSILPALDGTEARQVAIGLRLSEDTVPPTPQACDVFYALQSKGVHDSVPGFLAQPGRLFLNPFDRLGLRSSHYGFTRWLPAGQAQG